MVKIYQFSLVCLLAGSALALPANVMRNNDVTTVEVAKSTVTSSVLHTATTDDVKAVKNVKTVTKDDFVTLTRTHTITVHTTEKSKATASASKDTKDSEKESSKNHVYMAATESKANKAQATAAHDSSKSMSSHKSKSSHAVSSKNNKMTKAHDKSASAAKSSSSAKSHAKTGQGKSMSVGEIIQKMKDAKAKDERKKEDNTKNIQSESHKAMATHDKVKATETKAAASAMQSTAPNKNYVIKQKNSRRRDYLSRLD